MGPRKQKFPVQIVQANSQSIADGEASSAAETVIYDHYQHKLVNGVLMSADNASIRQPKKPRRAQQKTGILGVFAKDGIPKIKWVIYGYWALQLIVIRPR
jgi:hypothetical protein